MDRDLAPRQTVAGSSAILVLAEVRSGLGDWEQTERKPPRRRWKQSIGREISATTGCWPEIVSRPVREHEEEVVETDLAKTSLRGPIADIDRTAAETLECDACR